MNRKVTSSWDPGSSNVAWMKRSGLYLIGLKFERTSVARGGEYMDVFCNPGMLLVVDQFLFLQVCQQSFRSIFKQVKYGFETIDTAIVGIRHVGFTAVSSKL